jgi:hypothetical protein
MKDRRVERVLDTGTSGLSTNQAIRILLALVLIRGCTLWLRKGMRKGAIMYTTLTMPTGLATLTWWNTEVGRGCHYPQATTSSPWSLVYFKVTSSLGIAPTLSITNSLSAQAKQSLKAR